MTRDYIVLDACEIAGVWREKDALVALTDLQAQHLAPPLGCVVKATGKTTAGLTKKVRTRGRLDRN